jgi:hypothetical protein
MIPVDQTAFGIPNGNCLPACVASILEIDVAEVPSFCLDASRWFDHMREWLAPRGLLPLMLRCEPEPEHFGDAWLIVSGPADRGHDHSTVWRNGALVHDPHPSRAGLLSINDVIVFVAIDPKAVQR